jgi:hypothetical protein
MRTTISLDDRLAKQVRREAASAGLSVSAFIAVILDDAIKRAAPAQVPRFRLVTVGGAGLQPGVDLDQPNAIVVADDVEAHGFRRER